MSGFDPQRLARLAQTMQHHIEQDRVGGVAWLLAEGDHVEVGVDGQLTRGEPTPVGRDSIVAVAALILVEENTRAHGVMLSADAFAGPFPPPAVIQDFWNGASTALDN